MNFFLLIVTRFLGQSLGFYTNDGNKDCSLCFYDFLLRKKHSVINDEIMSRNSTVDVRHKKGHVMMILYCCMFDSGTVGELVSVVVISIPRLTYFYHYLM